MGLNVTLYHITSKHRCNQDTVYDCIYVQEHPHNNSIMYAPKTNIADFSKFRQCEYKCRCACSLKDQKLLHLHCGYVSWHERNYQIGDMLEYDTRDGFYFGPYSTYANASMKQGLEILRSMSDCDGTYSGQILMDLYLSLKSYQPKEDTPLANYQYLLEQHLHHLGDCVIVHH